MRRRCLRTHGYLQAFIVVSSVGCGRAGVGAQVSDRPIWGRRASFLRMIACPPQPGRRTYDGLPPPTLRRNFTGDSVPGQVIATRVGPHELAMLGVASRWPHTCGGVPCLNGVVLPRWLIRICICESDIGPRIGRISGPRLQTRERWFLCLVGWVTHFRERTLATSVVRGRWSWLWRAKGCRTDHRLGCEGRWGLGPIDGPNATRRFVFSDIDTTEWGSNACTHRAGDVLWVARLCGDRSEGQP